MLILQMAMPRKDYIQMLQGYKNVFMTHIFLIASSEPNNISINHWITQLTSWCKKIQSVKIKPKNNKPNVNDVLNHLLIKFETIQDADAIICSKNHDGKQLSISKDKLKKFFDSWKLFRIVLANSIVSDNQNSNEYYNELFKTYLI